MEKLQVINARAFEHLNSRTKSKLFFTALKATFDDQRQNKFGYDRFEGKCADNYKAGVSAFLKCMSEGVSTKPHTGETLATGFRQ
jgi:hypothetical protein